MIDPLALLAEDRRRAGEQDDPCASLCAVATVTPAGKPAVRTLVLRNLGDRLGIFINATSPKADEFRCADGDVAVLVYLPSIAVQYRLQCTLEPIAKQAVHRAWQRRPDMPKRMDWFYETHPQSFAFRTRQALLDAVAEFSPPEPLAAPASAVGFLLAPAQIERLNLAQPGGLHDRRRYALRDDGSWSEAVLVP